MPDFPPGRIPWAEFNPSVNAAMRALMLQRDRVDADLRLMLQHEAADGTPLDPLRDYEDDYQFLCAQLNTCNRALYTICAQYLDPATG
jgi:hypothetical protein